VLDEIVKANAQFVMLASGDKDVESKFERLQKKHPKNIALSSDSTKNWRT